MIKEMVLPNRFQKLSQKEAESVAGGAMRCSVKGERNQYDKLRDFFRFIIKR